MRHRNANKRKFSRSTAHRKALFVNLANALLAHERITTTEAKAKDLRGYAEKLISLGKRAAAAQGETAKTRATALRRLAFSELRNTESVERIFGKLAERYRDRKGGYTRVFRVGPRHGDNAPMAIIELVDRETESTEAGS